MKMTSNKYLFRCTIGAGLLLWAFSCTQVEESLIPEKESTGKGAPLVSLWASTEQGGGTKTTLGSDFETILWKDEEMINVFNNGQGSKFVASDIQGEVSTAEFKGNLSIDEELPIFGLYPYDEQAFMIDQATILTHLPSFQNGVANSFDDGLYICVAQADPGQKRLSFKNVCTGIRFKFSKSGYRSVKLTGNANELIAGPVLLDFDGNGIPVSSVDFTEEIEDEYGNPTTSVTVLAPDGGTFAPGTWYYLVFLPQAFPKGFTLTITGDDGVHYYRTTTPVTFERSSFKQATDLDVKEGLEAFSPEYVDLGLSVKWATTNVGSVEPTGYGDFFAWGETAPKGEFLESNYKWGTFDSVNATYTKYNLNAACGPIDNKWILDPEDDAATVNWGEGWRTPTAAELAELQRECTWTWQEDYDNTGVSGFLVTGPNGNSIFLSASGTNEPRRIRWKGNVIGVSLMSSNSATGTGSSAVEYDNGYWELLMGSPAFLKGLYGSDGAPFIDGETAYVLNPALSRYCRYDGLPVRPVYASLPAEDEIKPLIVFNDSDADLYGTEQPRLAVNTIPHNLDKELVFESQDPDIMTIDQEGNITAYQSGWAKLTVSFQDGSGFPLEYYLYADGATPGFDPDRAISFADASLEEHFVQKGIDTNGDKRISFAEAAAVTTLEGVLDRNMSFTSFDEFQYFTGIQTIPDNQFSYWTALQSIRLPKNVTSIGNNAFSYCVNLTSINIPNGVSTIGYAAFQNCTSLTSVTLPEGVTSIGNSAFFGCSNLTSINIPEGVTTIEYSTFTGCSSLTSIHIPESVKTIRLNVFNGCTALQQFSGNYASADGRFLVKDGEIIATAFASMQGDISIPDGVTAIGSYTFQNCTSLTSINIPDGVTSIGNGAFQRCSNLTSIHIPSSVTEMGGSVFSGCTALQQFSGSFASADGRFLVKDGQIIATAFASIQGNISIPDGVTTIGYGAFIGCSDLTSVNIPDGVTAIGDSAFNGCSNLTSINIPNGVATIGYAAFQSCTSLTSVTLPEGVTSIGNSAFNGCSNLTSINIPSNVTTIGNFTFSGCSSLTSINIPEGVTSIGNGAFQRCSNLTSINIPEGFTTVGNYVFSECTSLGSIAIPEGVTSIGNSAFNGCSNLTSINIPNGVATIGFAAFQNCTSLTSVTLPESVTSIGNSAFSDCSNLTSINIPDGVTTIEYYAFQNCTSLTSVTIPEGVTSIEDYAFQRCSSLTSINIPSGVTSIGNYVFFECTSLGSIAIPSGIISIGNYTFRYCNSLTSVTIKATTPPSGQLSSFDFGSSQKFYVPSESLETYKSTSPWDQIGEENLLPIE